MTAHLADSKLSLTESYHTLLLVDTDGYTNEGLEKYFDNLHRVSVEITKLDTSKLQSVNELISKEAQNLHLIIEKLTHTAVNDDSYLMVLNAVNHSLQIMESVLPVAL